MSKDIIQIILTLAIVIITTINIILNIKILWVINLILGVTNIVLDKIGD